MVLDRKWLLGVAQAEREAFGRTIQYTRPDAWESTSPWGDRPVRDVLAHLAATETAAAAIVAGERAEEVDGYIGSLGDEPFTLEGFIEWAVQRRADVSPVALATEWGRAADKLMAHASKADDHEWRERQISWLAGEIRLGYFIQSRVCQWWVHGQDIREGGGQEPRWEHPPTFCVNDFAIRLIPYALAIEGHSYPGMSVRVNLVEGVGSGLWNQGLEAGYVPPADKKPDVYIEGRGPWFALVATRRADADAVLYEGLLNTGGDVRAGEAILKSLRAFP